MVVNYKIENFLSSWSDDDMKPRVDFTILGEPGVQNGWKIRWKGLRFPRIYDPRSRDKASLRIALMEEMLEEIFPPQHPSQGNRVVLPEWGQVLVRHLGGCALP
jgi:hypothetical protein